MVIKKIPKPFDHGMRIDVTLYGVEPRIRHTGNAG